MRAAPIRDVDFAVSWHPFQLNPDLPREGVDRRALPRGEVRRPGARRRDLRPRARRRRDRRASRSRSTRIARQPNTLDAHRLISWAQRAAATPTTLVEALFRAYFLDGRYIGDRAVLAAIAGDAGFDAAAARAMLDSDAKASTRCTAMDRARARTRRHRRAVLHFRQPHRRLGRAGADALVAVIEEALAPTAA